MTTKNKKTEVVKTVNTGAVAKPTQEFNMDAFGGVKLDDIVKQTPYIVLVQGKNPLKKELGADDGDIVAEGEIMKEGMEIMPIKSKKIYMEKEVKFDKAGNLDLLTANTVNTMDEADFIQLKTEDFNGVYVQKNASGEIDKVYQPNLIMMVLSDGLPYQMSFKSYTKMGDAEKILNTVFRAAAKKKISMNQVVVKLTSKEKKSQDGFEYFGYEAAFARQATEEETALHSQFFASKDVDVEERPEVAAE